MDVGKVLRCEERLFPFLIGTVRTQIGLRVLAHITLFPFLIGTVRTETDAT